MEDGYVFLVQIRNSATGYPSSHRFGPVSKLPLSPAEMNEGAVELAKFIVFTSRRRISRLETFLDRGNIRKKEGLLGVKNWIPKDQVFSSGQRCPLKLGSGGKGRVLDTPMLAHFLSLVGLLMGAGLKCAPHLSGCISVGFFAAALSNRKQIVSGITRVNGDGAVE